VVEAPLKKIARQNFLFRRLNRAAEMDETLAMCNLGSKLLNIGFLELAREQCGKALKNPKPHPNVGNLVTSLATVEENEKLRQQSILDGVETQVSYLQRLGRAATFATPETIAENWQGPDCGLKFTRSGDRITLKGAYEREDGLLSALIAAPVGGTTPRPVSKSSYSVSYSGQIRGLAVIGEFKRGRDGSSLLASSRENKFFMIFREGGSEITVFEKTDSKEPNIQVIKRIS
jgi:hypothetical protein